MIHDAASFLVVVALLAAIAFGGLMLRRRFGWGGEASRKFVHVGMGCVTAAFPWMFSSSAPVILLAVVAVIAIAGLCRLPALRPALREIDRESLGELYFPVGVAFCFHFSAGVPALYCPPVFMLTFADALAALIGKRFGTARYTTHEGFKSWQGSTAFFVASFTTTVAALLMFSDLLLVEVMLIGVLFGMIGVILEAIAWRGLDNLFIPVVGLYVIGAYIDLEAGQLVWRIVVLLALAAIAFALKWRSTLNDSGLLGVAIVLYLAWAVAGWEWALAPFVVFVLYPLVVPFDYAEFQDRQSVTALVFINLVGFVWLAQAVRAGVTPTLFWPFSASYAIHLAMIWTKRAKVQGRRRIALWSLGAFPAIAVVAVLGLPLLAGGRIDESNDWAAAMATSWGCSVLCCWTVLGVPSFDGIIGMSKEEWLFRSVLAGAGSGVVWLV